MTTGVLIEITKGSLPRTHYLARPLTKIGRSRSAQCDILLEDDSISREHAVIERREDGYFLMDGDSRNGTQVNGIGVLRRVLRDGDRVRLGDAEFVFREIDGDVLPEQTASSTVSPEQSPTGKEAPTITVPTPSNVTAASEIRVINSWQIMKLFAAKSAGTLDDVLRAVVEDMRGMVDVGHCTINIGEWSMIGRAVEAHAAPEVPTHRPLIAALELAVAARQGKIVSMPDAGPGIVEALTAVDAVGFPIKVHGQSAGYLYVEGRVSLNPKIVDAMHAAADAIGVALSIWNSGRIVVRRSTLEERQSLGIIGKSRRLQQALRIAEKAARAGSTVLLRGETGTGKELFAKLIHQESSRKFERFFAVNCSVFQEHLLDDALFGHEKGAFTGAVGMKKGYFEALDHGTIFLDEIGELSPDVQAKLLRVLQEGEIIRIGGIEPVKVDVRVIAATHRDLVDLIRQGRFREDLYYRLNVIQIELPPLRERPEDVQELLRYYIEIFRGKLRTTVRDLTPEAIEALMRYPWPGNIRELRNIVERAMVLAEGEVLQRDDFPIPPDGTGASPSAVAASAPSGSDDLTLAEKERQYILEVLRRCAGNKTLAAKKLGISRTTLNEKLKDRDV